MDTSFVKLVLLATCFTASLCLVADPQGPPETDPRMEEVISKLREIKPLVSDLADKSKTFEKYAKQLKSTSSRRKRGLDLGGLGFLDNLGSLVGGNNLDFGDLLGGVGLSDVGDMIDMGIIMGILDQLLPANSDMKDMIEGMLADGIMRTKRSTPRQKRGMFDWFGGIFGNKVEEEVEEAEDNGLPDIDLQELDDVLGELNPQLENLQKIGKEAADKVEESKKSDSNREKRGMLDNMGGMINNIAETMNQLGLGGLFSEFVDQFMGMLQPLLQYESILDFIK